ncbi:4-hydroxybenzoate octaprenyltransferase [Thiolapillus brandeum]|uniref:4-hydroxybenzoate octaprenyltransferase n=1 Tax=Thiolapillus brandeum TaxID=1076588 RepID=A0A7U6GIG4_9GAMM|nr:4-hydroxybenzoate octaprenyltransferase [Thiolapillus brandeum]BAO44205.1 4-hydroxybenzoate octaprenyltransferase [Thiolapillus brandeum]
MENTAFRHRWSSYARLMRLDKPIGILLLLWPTLWALWIAAEGHPKPWLVAVFVAGVVLMRSAGCVINDYADRNIDRHVERTAERPLTAGLVSEKETLLLFGLLVGLAFVLVLTLNNFTIALSFVGAFLAASYPFTKRFTHLPQAYLGAAFGWAIPMVFAAQTGSIDPRSWWLFLAVLVWALIYDTMYAMVDRADDLKIGVKSTAILFGSWDRLIIGLLQLTFLGILYHVGHLFFLGRYWYMALGFALGLMLYHQWLIRQRDRALCFKAFLHNHWIGVVIFLGILANYYLP